MDPELENKLNTSDSSKDDGEPIEDLSALGDETASESDSTKQAKTPKQVKTSKQVETPNSAMHILDIGSHNADGKATKKPVVENGTPLSSKSKSLFSDLTSTKQLQSLVSGRPTKDVKLQVVGYTVPVQAKNSTFFRVYLANSEKFVMRLTAWNADCDNLSKRIKMHSKVHFNNLDVRKYWVAEGERNVTSSQYEFNFNSPNSKIIQVSALPPAELSKLNVDYPQPNNFPPYWKFFANLHGNRDRHLAGHAVVLQSFEAYTLSVGRYTPKMDGVYGIVGDESMTKVALFVKANAHETEDLLEDMTQGVEFHFQNASVQLRGATLWLLAEFAYTVAISSDSDHNMGLSQDSDDYQDWASTASHSAKRKAVIPDDVDDSEPTTSSKRGLYM